MTCIYIGLGSLLRGAKGRIRCDEVHLYWSGEVAERNEGTDKHAMTCIFIGLGRLLKGMRGRIRCDDLHLYWYGETAERNEGTDKIR